jgi:hypothetical protein
MQGADATGWALSPRSYVWVKVMAMPVDYLLWIEYELDCHHIEQKLSIESPFLPQLLRSP